MSFATLSAMLSKQMGGQSRSVIKGSGSNSMLLECTRLKNLRGKQGILKPDADGCYTIVVGALNSYNNKGDYYVYEKACQLFEASSSLQRRIAKGSLKAEYHHPDPDKIEGYHAISNASERSRVYMNRLRKIDTTMVCCTFRAIWLDKDNYKDDDGNSIVAIVAKIKPSGPYGPALQRDLESAGENVMFSIRAFSDDYIDGNGQNLKVLAEIVCFDHVGEGGIANAEKLKSASLEDFGESILSSVRVTKDMLLDVLKQNKDLGIAIEDSGHEIINDIVKQRGWDKKEPTSIKKENPFFTNWG